VEAEPDAAPPPDEVPEQAPGDLTDATVSLEKPGSGGIAVGNRAEDLMPHQGTLKRLVFRLSAWLRGGRI
jgi:hypothetical protein